MKTRQLAVLLTAGAMFGAAGASHADNAMYSCTRADGTVSLTNVPVSAQCEQLFTYKPPVDAAPAPVTAIPAAPVAAVAAPTAAQPIAAQSADQKARARDPNATPGGAGRSSLAMRMSQRRDAARQAVADAYARGEPASVANPATSRRYLMTNRADYMQANGFTP